MTRENILEDARAEPGVMSGVRIPLFDRLAQEPFFNADDAPVQHFYNRFEAIQSIEREVERLLNTRATLRRDMIATMSEDPINYGIPGMYGIPDFSQYDGANSEHWPVFARLCQQAIDIYEPRLRNASISVVGFDSADQGLSAIVTADLALKEFQGEVTFPVVVRL